MAHRRAKLTPFGRLLLVQRIVDLQWPVTQAAASLGVSRPIASSSSPFARNAV
jgi:hypothetical protein